jgi:ketosteroid isomerase-like protein
MSSGHIALVQDLYAAFGRGDIASIVAKLDANVDWCSVGRSSDYAVFGPRRGIAAVQQFFKIVADNQDFSEFSPLEFHADADKVFVLGRYACKMKKTGKPVACEWAHVFTIKDGSVVKWREHTDTAQFAEANRG